MTNAGYQAGNWAVRLYYALLSLLPAFVWVNCWKKGRPGQSFVENMAGIHVLYFLVMLLIPYQTVLTWLIFLCPCFFAAELVLLFCSRLRGAFRPEVHSWLGGILFFLTGILLFLKVPAACALALMMGYMLFAIFLTLAEAVFTCAETGLQTQPSEYRPPELKTVPEYAAARLRPKIPGNILRVVTEKMKQSGRTMDVQQFIDRKCNVSHDHSYHVSDYTFLLCRCLGYDADEAAKVSEAAFWHDIGKIQIDDEILFKEQRLEEQEFDEIKRHTQYGFQILNGPDPFDQLCAEIALHHHEHFDGSGYHKMVGEQINVFARIVSVVDVFDALTSKRQYKRDWSVAEAVEYIGSHAGDYFDPEVAGTFVANKKYFMDLYRQYGHDENESITERDQ